MWPRCYRKATSAATPVLPAFHDQRSSRGLYLFICSSRALEDHGESWQLFHILFTAPILLLPGSSSPLGSGVPIPHPQDPPAPVFLSVDLDVGDDNHCSEKPASGASSIDQAETGRGRDSKVTQLKGG